MPPSLLPYHILSKFNNNEVEIILESADFAKNQPYLVSKLQEVYSGKAKFIEMDEAEQRIEDIIKKHESSV